jgi:hypothetical protein
MVRPLPCCLAPVRLPRVTTVPLTPQSPERSLACVIVDLTAEQQSKLDRIAGYAGKPAAQVLTEAAMFLLENDLEFWESVQRGIPRVQDYGAAEQVFLGYAELDARLTSILRR